MMTCVGVYIRYPKSKKVPGTIEIKINPNPLDKNQFNNYSKYLQHIIFTFN